MVNNKTNTTESIQIEPNFPATASIIWLHGLGADGNDFAPIVPELKLPNSLPVRFIFPHAPLQPVTINNGYVMRAWYDIISLGNDRNADRKGILQSVNLIHQLIAQEVTRGIPYEKIILAGFSQGAVIALTTGLTYPHKLGGIMALSGYLPFADDVFATATACNKTTPLFVAHGTEDAVVPYALGQLVEKALIAHHYPLSWHSYPMAHSVCLEEMIAIGEWIQIVARTKR